MSSSLTAFVVAFGASLLLTPAMRRVARTSGLVDEPAARKVHTRDVPYMGGIAIMGAALVGLLVRPGITTKLAFLAFVAVVLGIVGLLDDDRTLPVRPRLFTQFAAATAAVCVGVRATPTGIPVWDVAFTIVWIVAMTNAMNLLDNMDGLAGGISFAIAIGVYSLASFGGQVVVAALAAGIAGACLGFLAFNWRPASIFMGDAGALFLGFVLSVAVLDLHPIGLPPAGFVVRMLLFGLPLLDTVTVVLARARRGVSVMQGGRDHLSHRLVALGLSSGMAVAMLVLVQLALSATAVFAGRGVLSIAAALGLGIGLLGVLEFFCTRPAIYTQRVRGLPRPVRLATTLVVTGLVVACAVVALVSWRVRRDVNAGRNDVELAIDALHRGDTSTAQTDFAAAGQAFHAANGLLGSPLVLVGRAIPVVAPNLNAVRDVVATGEHLTAAGTQLATAVDPKRLEVQHGSVPVAELQRVAPDITGAARILRDSRARLQHIDRGYLLPFVRSGIDELENRLLKAEVDGDRVDMAARLAPTIFGAHGVRHYFLAVQNSAELRATGGFIGNWGILTADNGHVSLDRFERIGVLDLGGNPSSRVLHAPADFVARYTGFGVATTWQNINLSPDFPTVARVIQDLLPQSGGPHVDGVIAIDSSGLAALLKLTGPVSVANWPVPITADNVVDVTLRDAYERFTSEDVRADFLGDVARSVWSSVISSNLGAPQHIGEALAPAAADGHMLVWLADANQERFVEAVGVSGRVPSVRSDSLLVVTQNAAGNKADYYLHRRIAYTVAVDPTSATAANVHGSVSVRLDNGLPATGLPRIVAGPYDERFQAGENRSFVSVYTPFAFSNATLDGKAVPLESERELGRRVYSLYEAMPSMTTHDLQVALTGTTPLVQGWYRLDLGKQPTLGADDVQISVTIPSGWKIIDTVGGGKVARNARTFTVHESASSSFTIGVRLARTHAPSILDRLRAG